MAKKVVRRVVSLVAPSVSVPSKGVDKPQESEYLSQVRKNLEAQEALRREEEAKARAESEAKAKEKKGLRAEEVSVPRLIDLHIHVKPEPTFKEALSMKPPPAPQKEVKVKESSSGSSIAEIDSFAERLERLFPKALYAETKKLWK